MPDPSLAKGPIIALDFDYSTGAPYSRHVAQVVGINHPSRTIFCVDSAKVNKDVEEGYKWVYPAKSSDKDAGLAYPRHNGSANSLWVDGHASAQKAPDPKSPESIYDPGGLGDRYDNPSNWLRE